MIKSNIIAPYKPLEWQVKPFYDKSSTMLLTGSAGGGKSRIAAEKVHAYCQHYAGSTWLILRKAREWAGKSIVPFMWQTVMGRDPSIKFNMSDGAFFYPNGSVIYSGGMMDDKQRESVRSIGGDGGLDGAWFEEANAFNRQDYEEIIGRVRHTAADWQQIILTTNPDAPTHWIYKDLIQGNGATVYYSGAWVQAEGAIYDEYDPAIHMIDRDKCPEFIRRFRVIDFGYSNPFVCQWWGMDADGRLYRYREVYVTRKLVEDLTPVIIKLSIGESIEFTVSDHDAEDRATMERHGISTRAAKKDVSSGIQSVKARMKVQPNGKPRIYFVRGALVDVDPLLEADKKPLCTEDEIPGYAWKKYPDGKPNKEEPVKLNDHGCDTTRYIVMEVDSMHSAHDMIDFA
jgi:phage terminase large subunit